MYVQISMHINQVPHAKQAVSYTFSVIWFLYPFIGYESLLSFIEDKTKIRQSD